MCKPFQVDGDDSPPGTYYIPAAMREPANEDRGRLIPTTLAIAVEGQAKPDPADALDFGAPAPGAPPVVSSSAPPSPKPSTPADAPTGNANAPDNGGGDEDTNLALPLGVAAGGLVLGAVSAYLLRIRRSAFNTDR